MIIDAHQHYWDPARVYYSWLEPGSSLDRRWLPDDLAPLLDACGVAGTILVQAAPTEQETDWLLDLAAREASVRGVVGWLDLDAADFGDRLERRRGRGLVGVRPMLQDLADPDWIAAPARAAALAALAESGLAFDALVRPDGLGAIAAVADRYPGLRIVLDHAGKPPFGHADALERWQTAVRALAERPNVVCKLSGLLTEMPPGGDMAPVRRAIGFLLETWTPQCLLWGSDWPVVTLAGDYESWFALAGAEFADLSEGERAAVLGGNACAVYGL